MRKVLDYDHSNSPSRFKRWVGTFGIVMAGALLLTACSSSSSKPSTTTVPTTAKKLIYFIYNGPTPPYFAPMAQAITDVSKYYPTLDIKTINAGGSATTEATDVSEALGAGAQGIILNTISETDTTAAENAMAHHVPVITIDRDVSTPSARIAFVGDNDVTLGKDLTSYAISQLEAMHIPTPWNVVVLQGTLGASVSIGRQQGTMDVLNPYEKSGKVKVILDTSGNFSTSTAQSIMSTELAKTTNIQLVAAANDAMALGAIAALESHGITPGKHMLVAGADAQPQSLTDVANGTQVDTVTHSPFIEAYWAVEAMWNYLYHKTLPPPSKFPNGKVLIPMHLVTKANVSTIGPWGTPSVVPPLPYGISTSHKITS